VFGEKKGKLDFYMSMIIIVNRCNLMLSDNQQAW